MFNCSATMACFVQHTLPLVLACFVTLILQADHTTCSPIKRSTNDGCYGTECQIDLSTQDNTQNTELLENITKSLVPAIPEIIHQLQNIAYINRNTSTTAYSALPSIVDLLEASQNQLVENSPASINQNLAELTSLIQSQQDKQERHNQNTSANLQQMTNLLQDQTDKQNQVLENVAAFLPILTKMVQIQQDTLQQLITQTYSLHPPPLPGCLNGLASGSYLISSPNDELASFHVYCDMETDGGRWIIFQRRFDGSVSFDRNWEDYENGFGSLEGEFWQGLRKLHALTSQGRWELRVDLEDFDGNRAYAHYDNFEIGNSSSLYRLTIGSYSGTAGDSIGGSHDLNGMAFTTKDKDQDLRDSREIPPNCAVHYRSGWWHRNCAYSNVNGLYLGQNGIPHNSIHWYQWTNSQKLLKKSELKIRLGE